MSRARARTTMLVLVASCLLTSGRLASQESHRSTAIASKGAAASRTSPDIIGLRPGVPLQEAYDRLRAHNRIAKVGAGRMAYADFGAEPVTFALVQAEDGQSSAELIEADVTLPPGKQVVWRLVRKLQFTPGKAPLVEDLLTALREKYGTESYGVRGGVPALAVRSEHR